MDSEDDDRSPLAKLGNTGWFVALVYVVAFGPWVFYGVVDHVDSKWRKIDDLRWQTSLAALVCYYSIWLLLFYAATQFFAEDWKEAMAALVVFFAAWLPWLRFLRESWLLASSRSLGRVLHSLPHFGGCVFWSDFKQIPPGTFDDKGSWRPGNSNHFFDNDDPGEGVTDVSLLASLVAERNKERAKRQLEESDLACQPREAAFLTGDNPRIASWYDKKNHDLAMDVVRHRLRVLVAGGQPELNGRRVSLQLQAFTELAIVPLEILAACMPAVAAAERDFMRSSLQAQEGLVHRLCENLSPIFKPWEGGEGNEENEAKNFQNGLTRALWLYENLTGRGWQSKKRGKLAQVLHLGLVVHVGMVMVQGFAPEKLDWVNVLVGPSQSDATPSEGLRRPSYGHLKVPGMLLWTWFPKGLLQWPRKDGFDDVFAKLHPGRSSLKENGHLCWENIMFMACSTIELHAFVVALFGKRPQCRLFTCPIPGIGIYGAHFIAILQDLLQLLQLRCSSEDMDVLPEHRGHVDTIWTYVAGAFVANHVGSSTASGEQKKLHESISELQNDYRAELDEAFIAGSSAEANWKEVILHCGNIVDVVTNALHRDAPKERPQTLMPDDLKDEDWAVELTNIKTALVETLERLLPSYQQSMVQSNTPQDGDLSATVLGSASNGTSVQAPSSAAVDVLSPMDLPSGPDAHLTN